MRKTRKKKQPLQGFIQSGMIFIGDPVYMAGNPQDYEWGEIPEDPSNPFKNFDKFTDEAEGQDLNLKFLNSYKDDPVGRGCVIQVQQLNGKFQVKKTVDKVTGKLKSITIKLIE